jgi:flagellar basal body P-ring formation protein FlgA
MGMRLFLFVWALLMCWPAFAGDGVRVVVPTHDIPLGATIMASDLTFRTVDGDMLQGTVTAPDELVGLQTRRFLRAGEAVRGEDVKKPVLVAKGSTVTMSFEAPGITLTAMGRAMSEGGMGDTVTVQNPTSFRQVSAVVIGPGQVRAQDAAASIPSRLASVQP